MKNRTASRILATGCTGVVFAATPAFAQRTVSGTVFADNDGDGLMSANDDPVAGAVVFWESDAAATTDADGGYSLSTPDTDGIVWVRTPGDFVPGPVWQSVAGGAGGAQVDLALTRSAISTPLSFVVASDTHTGPIDAPPEDIESCLIQATDLDPAPHFVVITGDITNANQPEEFDTIMGITDSLVTPFVPVPGNHDWYDGGLAYRTHLGPPNYSFDQGGVHFVVLNDTLPAATQLAFLSLDRSLVAGDPITVVFIHAPPDTARLSALEAAGVDYIFSGHFHANRAFEHGGGMIELNTQPLAQGGIDTSPGGYRVVTLGLDGLQSYHRTTVVDPILTVTYPRPSEPVVGCSVDVIAAAELTARTPRVRARIAGGPQVELARAGGWNYRGEVPAPCEPGRYRIEIEAFDASGVRRSTTSEVRVAYRFDSPLPPIRDWPQLQGGPDHHGSTAVEIAPPLSTVWATSAGANLYGGSPVVGDGRVFVPIADFSDGRDGGVVALDAATGRQLWAYRAGAGVRGAPAVADGIVVIGGLDGVVTAVSAHTGEQLWSYQLAPAAHVAAAGSLYASPTIANGLVHVGIKLDYVALDLETGGPVWQTVPISDNGLAGTHTSPVIDDGIVVSTFGFGNSGVIASDAATGDELWRVPRDPVRGPHASPVIAQGRVYVTDWTSRMTALDLLTGAPGWSRKLSEDGLPYWFGQIAAAAYSNGTLFVPTTHDHLFAIDATTGVEWWRFSGTPSLIYSAHGRSRHTGFNASPVVTGDIVWVGGTDGALTALAPGTGQVLWQDQLGSPIAMGLAPAGSLLIVATYDGTVRAMRAVDRVVTPPEAPVPPATLPQTGGGCSAGDASSGSPAALLAIALALALLARRRSGTARPDQRP